KINREYKNPTTYRLSVSLQTHSVTVTFLHNNEEILSVDVVPAYITSKNEFQEDMYKVPEILKKRHGKSRAEYYQKLAIERKEMGWIDSDPRGYIKVASDVDNSSNGEFRKSVKLVKHWKNKLSEEDETLKLKSFHLEQVVTQYFREDGSLQVFDAVYRFFIKLPEMINNPNQIKDRANNDKYIDDYLGEFTDEQKEKIVQARDAFLVKLENVSDSTPISSLFIIEFLERNGTKEKYLFDSEFRVPIFVEDHTFRIDGFIQKKDGFRDGWLSEVNHQIAKGRQVKFQIRHDVEKDYTLWKVQNDKHSEEVLADDCTRGEITMNQTHQNPESTAYKGIHYVECFAVKDGVCIARSKIDVVIS
ncbi:MAG TPA: hypothetical protein PLS49_02190, partial [Candidatus Woesebacteria bacterium]|nr:hypothetical protein [Candidatus Woesebacteria bacterium]